MRVTVPLRQVVSLLQVLGLFALGGCAVHPLPENVTGLNTIAIAKQIRCEARSAVIRKAEQLLGASDIPGAPALAATLHAHPELYVHFRARKLLTNAEEIAFYDKYSKTSIAFDFTFDITEDNLASTQVDFVRVLTNGTVSLPLTASSDRSRQNVRKFLVTDTFENLLDEAEGCEGFSPGPNLLYPITGNIGLDEVVSSFIDLNLDGFTLSVKDKSPALADMLQFNTTEIGTAAPRVVLTPAGHAFRLADAALTSTQSRIDRHAVIIGLSLPPKAPPPAVAAPGQPLLGVASRSVFARRTDISPAEVRAVEVITQLRIDLYYDRAGQIVAR